MPCRALPFFLLFLGPTWASDAESSLRLPAPKDVVVYSYNFCSSLRWSPVEVERGLVLYTVHLKTAAFNQWEEINCTRIARTQCSFPEAVEARRFWTVVLRVRAELGHRASDWVQTDPFVAGRDTTIGPPIVNSVTVSSDSLLVNVTPPFGPEAGDSLRYHVSYWENATGTAKKETKMSNTLFKIKNLKQLTLYCFTIQVELMHTESQRLGLQSVPRCYRTTISEATKAGYVVVIFMSVGLLLILIILGLFYLWRHHKTIKYLSQPPLRIPSHIEEYLRDPSMLYIEVLENYVEEEPHEPLSTICIGGRSEAYSVTLAGNTSSPSVSRGSDVT